MSRDDLLWWPRVLAPRPDASDRKRGARAPDATDEELIRASATGDQEAFAVIVQRYERRLFQFIRWTLREHHDLAEDALQEALLQIYRSAASFAGESTFRTWAYGLARNVARHQIRRYRRDAVFVDPEEPFAHIPDERLDPLAALTRQELVNEVRQALEALPAASRIVLMLRDWEELSYAEIADILDVPVGTVRSRLHNARARLAVILQERRKQAP